MMANIEFSSSDTIKSMHSQRQDHASRAIGNLPQVLTQVVNSRSIIQSHAARKKLSNAIKGVHLSAKLLVHDKRRRDANKLIIDAINIIKHTPKPFGKDIQAELSELKHFSLRLNRG
ncbi:MAG: hypothetical protein KTR16_12285 [Acidiferrobacterales bacterium]|nr:hypothetical protein [Acidiferrobacterales bacterium]